MVIKGTVLFVVLCEVFGLVGTLLSTLNDRVKGEVRNITQSVRQLSLSYTMVYKSTKVYTNDTRHQHGREILFLLHTRILKRDNLPFANSIISPPCALKYKTIISSSPVCDTECHDLNNLLLIETFTDVDEQYHIDDSSM